MWLIRAIPVRKRVTNVISLSSGWKWALGAEGTVTVWSRWGSSSLRRYWRMTGKKPPAGEGGGEVFNGDGRSVLGVRSRAGHRPLRDDQRGEMLRYLYHQGPMLPLATPSATWAYKPSLAECLLHTRLARKP